MSHAQMMNLFYYLLLHTSEKLYCMYSKGSQDMEEALSPNCPN